jgi:hypothetical protein
LIFKLVVYRWQIAGDRGLVHYPTIYAKRPALGYLYRTVWSATLLDYFKQVGLAQTALYIGDRVGIRESGIVLLTLTNVIVLSWICKWIIEKA